MFKKFTVLALLSCLTLSSGCQALTPFKLGASTNVIDLRLFGTWKAQTYVISSDCKYVEEGKSAKSTLRFKFNQGEVKPEWLDTHWDLVANRRVKLNNDDSLVWERDNKFIQAYDKKWFVRSKDYFSFDEKDNLVAHSFVKQYLNGKYVGSYETVSLLKRASERYMVSKK
jgi:hypothetical protein